MKLISIPLEVTREAAAEGLKEAAKAAEGLTELGKVGKEIGTEHVSLGEVGKETGTEHISLGEVGKEIGTEHISLGEVGKETGTEHISLGELNAYHSSDISFGRLVVKKTFGYRADRKRIDKWIEDYETKSRSRLAEYKKAQERFSLLSPVRFSGFFAHINALSEQYIQKAVRSIRSFDSMEGDYRLLPPRLRAMKVADVEDLSTGEYERFGDNCYEFATGDAFSPDDVGDLIINPGYTCVDSAEHKRIFSETTGCIQIPETADGWVRFRKDWLALMKKDLNKVGKEIVEINNPNEAKPGSIVMAAVCCENDYHFYRYFPEYGYWAHKRGSTPVHALDNSGMPITDVKKCDRGMYSHFIGYYEITPMKPKKSINYLEQLLQE